MAFLGRTLAGMLIGFGAGILGRFALASTSNGPESSSVGTRIRPIAKEIVRATLAASERARMLGAEAGEQVSDLVAEVRAESGAGQGAAPEVTQKRAT